ncbi:MAG: hypothetical protein WBQ95_14085 [Terracidiphilus sp.]
MTHLAAAGSNYLTPAVPVTGVKRAIAAHRSKPNIPNIKIPV